MQGDECTFTWGGDKWLAGMGNHCSQSGQTCSAPAFDGSYIGQQTTTQCSAGPPP